MGWMDGMGLNVISVFNFLRILWVYTWVYYKRYIPTYTCNKKLSPAFLWISNFDVKLGVVEYHFQNYPMYVSFQIFGYKNRLLFSLIQ